MGIEAILLFLSLTSVVSYETTGRGVADHAISAASGEDCKIARGISGENVCEPVAKVTIEGYRDDAVHDFEDVLARRAGK